MSRTFGNQLYSIHTGNHISGISVELGNQNRNFYQWGGQSIIDMITKYSRTNGAEIDNSCGVHCKGGSQNTSDVCLIDSITTLSKPYMLTMAYENIAILQERLVK